MQKYRDNVTIQGRGGLVPVRNANVTVYNHGTNDKAVIYSNVGKTPKENPFQADGLGAIFFYAENGRYDLLIQGDGQSLRIDDILMEDVWEEVDDLEYRMPIVESNAQQAYNIATAIEDQSDASRGASVVGYRINAVGSVGRTQSDKNSESVSLLDFTGPADGNGTGGGTDRTVAFQRAYEYLASKGGGKLFVPISGTGIYRVDGAIEPAENTTTIVDESVTIDFTNRPPGGVNGHSILIQGQFSGAEIPLGANANRGDLQITTATPHGLSPGDWFLLKGQRNAIHADAGPDWRLGTPTGNPDAHALYFGEPCMVSEVISPTVIRLAKGLIFPDYRTDDSQETSILARPTTTIQKMLMKSNVHWRGGTYINNGTTVFLLNITKRCSVMDVYGKMGSKVGSFIQNRNGLENSFKGSAEHSSVYYIVADHSQYNSFKELSSWWSTWEYEDRYGTQAFDGTYILNGTPSIGPVITGSSYDAQEQALTFHGGTYGWFVKNLRSYRARQCAMTIRSRFGVIESPFIFGPNINLLGGIQFSQWGIDCQVNGGFIEGYQRGITIGTDDFPQPIKKNITVDGTTFKRCARGIHATTKITGSVPNSEASGLVFRNIRLSEISEFGIRLDPYVNYARIDNIYVENIADGCEGVSVANNSVGHSIDNVTGENIQPAAFLIRTNGITDTATFPTAVWSSSRIKLGYYKNVGSDFHTLVLNGTATYNIKPNGYSFTHRDQDDTVYYDSATSGSWIIPQSNSFLPPGAKITIVNRGSGTLTITPAAGVTLGSTSGTTLSQNQAATLLKINLTTWTMMK